MATFSVKVGNAEYDVDAPDENTAWQWANIEHQKTLAPASEGRSIAEQLKTLPQDLLRQTGLGVRNVITGVTGIPGMAADAAMEVANLATGRQQQMPTEALQQALTKIGLPEPRSGIERATGVVQSAITGGRVPIPSMGAQVPASFQPAQSLAQREFSKAREAGYVVPPASVNPSIANVALESAAGKAATQQIASGRNQQVTNALAARSVGLPEKQQITPAALAEVRAKAGEAYKNVSESGRIRPDRQYFNDLRGVRQTTSEIASDFPEADIGSAEAVDKLVKSLAKRSFDAKSAVAYMKELRKSSTANLSGVNAADPAKLSLGRAQRDAADALEEMVTRHLDDIGMPELSKAFDDARRTIAKSYTVQGALETTGNVNASKLAALLRKGKPLSAELETAARFAGAFPKAAVTPEKFGSPGVSALDFAMTAGGAAALPFLDQDPYLALAYPAIRYGARNVALSKALQQGLIKPPARPRPEMIGAAAGAFNNLATGE